MIWFQFNYINEEQWSIPFGKVTKKIDQKWRRESKLEGVMPFSPFYAGIEAGHIGRRWERWYGDGDPTFSFDGDFNAILSNWPKLKILQEEESIRPSKYFK